MNIIQALPIIILLESHIDTPVAASYRTLLPKLIDMGYNRLCLEAPSSMPVDELKSNIRLSIDYTEKDLLPSVTTSIQKYVKNLKSEQHLLSLDFRLVSELIKTYYSTTHYSTHATRLLSLTPNKLTLQYLEDLTPRINICGIDIDTRFNPLEHTVYDEEREKHMVNKLVEHRKNGSNIIFKVGKIHLFGLYRLLDKLNLLDQTMFFDLSSKETLDPGFTATEKTFMQTHSHKIHKIHFDTDPVSVALQVSKIEALINKSRLPAFGVALDLVHGLNTEFFSSASGTRPRPN